MKNSWIFLFFLFGIVPGYSQTSSQVIPSFVYASNRLLSTDSLQTSHQSKLSDKWEEFTLVEEHTKENKPRPISLPIAVEQTKSESVLRISEVVDTLSDLWVIQSTDAILSSQRPQDGQTKIVRFPFYGIEQLVTVPQQYGSFHPKEISEKEVEAFWEMLSKSDYHWILSDCEKYKAALGFNDWATLQWVQALSEAIFPKNINSERDIFTVFILNQMGLQVKLARSEDKLITLFSSMQQIYSRKFVTIDTYPYYLAENNLSASSVYTYRGSYVQNGRPLDLRLSKPLRLDTAPSVHKINYKSSFWDSTFSYNVSQSLLDFYNDYPQLDANVYATAETSPEFKESLRLFMIQEPLMDDVTFINKILSFLHLDFKYMVDQEQFGYEKPFFLEENFIYPYNDCEDRSIMLSVLLRDLLGLKSVLLDYDDHMCVAVNIHENIKGDHLLIGSAKYYVCDPTYIGATIGMAIPEYKKKPAKVWVL